MPKTHLIKKLQHFTADQVITTLKPYVTERRQQRIQSVLDHRLSSIQIVLEMPYDINNALAILRTCECFGIQHCHVIQPQGEAMSLRRLTRGAWYWVDITIHQSLTECLQQLSATQFFIAGAALQGSQPLHAVPVDQPLVLLLGNEQQGLSEVALQACDMTYQISMSGMTESLNLSAAAAISLHDTTQRKRQLLNTNGDLSDDEKTQLTARYFLNSVNYRLVNNLLPSK